MRQTWMAPANKVIEAVLKNGFVKVYNLEDAHVFSTTKDINKINSSNIIVVQRKNISTHITFGEKIDKKIKEKIHNDSYGNTKEIGFFPNLSVILQNKKTKEYKLFQLQPMFTFGILIMLGVFDYTNDIKFPKLSNKLSNAEKHKKIVKKMKDDGFKTAPQLSAVFNLYEDAGKMKDQIQAMFPETEWEWIGPESEYHEIEKEFIDKWVSDIKWRVAAQKALGENEPINADYQYKEQYDLYLETLEENKFLKYVKAIRTKEKNKKEKTPLLKIIENFEEKEKIWIPNYITDKWCRELNDGENKKEGK